MEIKKQIDIKDKFVMKDVCAVWTLTGKAEHLSSSVSFFEANGMVKIKLDSSEGSFVFDKNTLQSYPDFRIKFNIKKDEGEKIKQRTA